MAKSLQYITKFTLVLAGMVACSGFVASGTAQATDLPSPFAIDSSQWITFDHYKEKQAKGSVVPAPSVPAAEAETPAETHTNANDAPVKKEAAAAPAAPERPVNLPVMPGMNKGYDVQVSSTADAPPVAQITNLETQPTVAFPESNWQSATEAAKHNFAADSIVHGDEEVPDLHVRMSYLPNTEIKPVLYDRKPTRGRGTKTAAPFSPKPQPSADDKASLAALEAFKKQQLMAIQSDRQTLKALQDAISSLGLQKDLNFMAGSNGNMDTAGGMDLPANPAPTVK